MPGKPLTVKLVFLKIITLTLRYNNYIIITQFNIILCIDKCDITVKSSKSFSRKCKDI